MKRLQLLGPNYRSVQYKKGSCVPERSLWNLIACVRASLTVSSLLGFSPQCGIIWHRLVLLTSQSSVPPAEGCVRPIPFFPGTSLVFTGRVAYVVICSAAVVFLLFLLC